MSKLRSDKRPDRADYLQALKSMDTLIDITVDDLMTLSERAEQIASRRITETIGIARVMSTPVRTVRPHTPVCEVAHLMISERITGVPVVDAAERLVGIVTETDFLRMLGVPGQQHDQGLRRTIGSLFNRFLARRGVLEAPNDPVGAHMVPNVVCVHPEQDLHHVIEVMKQRCVSRVVVCDDQRRVLGIVTRSDLVRVFFDNCVRDKSKQS